ncbi:MAG: hypothetical protein L0G99_16160 [Propionibacteriales bacterium]|nr:hypothetical protein [Propionibacteriales bacterium]
MGQYEQIVWHAGYFKAHADHWRRGSRALQQSTREATEAKAPDTALWTTLVPGFKAVHDEVCAQIISSMLQEGVRQSGAMAAALETAARHYVNAETANEREARGVLAEAGIQ